MASSRNAKYCSVAACPSKSTDGAKLHFFPRDDGQRETWAAFVRDSGRNNWSPKPASKICSLHFSEECYFQSPKLMQEFERLHSHLRLHTNLRLVPGAVPTIGVPTAEDPAHGGPTQPKRRKSEGCIDAGCAGGSQSSVGSLLGAADVDLRTDGSANAGSVDSSVNLVVAAPCPNEPPPHSRASDAQTQCYVQVALKATQASIKLKTKSIRTQTESRTREMACQTDLALPEILLLEETRRASTPVPAAEWSGPPLGELSLTFDDDPLDKNFEPSSREELDSSAASVMEPSSWQPGHEPTASDPSSVASEGSAAPVSSLVTRKFIVCESNLLELFETCRKCRHPVTPSLRMTGSLVVVTTTCASHSLEWRSQLNEGTYAVGNVDLAAAILFNGCSPAKCLNFLNSAGICCISQRTFYRIQKKILLPAVDQVWQEQQAATLERLKAAAGGVKLAGDSRADSPGYSAKYGTYSLIETSINKVVDVQVVQSNEVASSGHMELEGLKRALQDLDDRGVAIEEVVTDRHPQVRKFFKTERPEVNHFIDAWHVAKGLRKKVLAASKAKGCEILALWCQTITNHLYHAVKVGGGDGELAVAVWLSVLNHVQDKHDGHGPLYDKCLHGELERRKWIHPGTDAFDKLRPIVSAKRLLDDIKQISPALQTYGVESFHSVINRFAPKAFPFSYRGIVARCTLSALHYNENAGRKQATTRNGDPRFQVVFPKARKGGHTVAAIKVPPTYGYLDHLQRAVDDRLNNANGAPSQLQPVPPPLTSSVGPVDKEAAVQAFWSRFDCS